MGSIHPLDPPKQGIQVLHVVLMQTGRSRGPRQFHLFLVRFLGIPSFLERGLGIRIQVARATSSLGVDDDSEEGGKKGDAD